MHGSGQAGEAREDGRDNAAGLADFACVSASKH